MKKIVTLSFIAAATLGLAACNKSEPVATNDAAAEVNATEAEAVNDINAAVDNVTDASNSAVDNISAADNAVADNASNAM